MRQTRDLQPVQARASITISYDWREASRMQSDITCDDLDEVEGDLEERSKVSWKYYDLPLLPVVASGPRLLGGEKSNKLAVTPLPGESGGDTS
jgi:hypothetical protein